MRIDQPLEIFVDVCCVAFYTIASKPSPRNSRPLLPFGKVNKAGCTMQSVVLDIDTSIRNPRNQQKFKPFPRPGIFHPKTAVFAGSAKAKYTWDPSGPTILDPRPKKEAVADTAPVQSWVNQLLSTISKVQQKALPTN